MLVNSVAASHIPTCDYFTFDLLKSNKIKNPFPGHTSHIQGLVASGFSVGEWRYRTFPSPQNVVFDGAVLECEVSRVKTPVFLPTLEDCFFQMSHPLPSYKPHSKVQLSGPPLPRGPLAFKSANNSDLQDRSFPSICHHTVSWLCRDSLTCPKSHRRQMAESGL